jgi:fibronectin-binding autotransporter adhesin
VRLQTFLRAALALLVLGPGLAEAGSDTTTWQAPDPIAPAAASWNDPANWSNGVPDASTDAIFPDDTSSADKLNKSVRLEAGSAVRSMTIGPGYGISSNCACTLTLHGDINAEASTLSGFTLELAAGQHAVDVSPFAQLDVSAPITGSGGLVKQNLGALQFFGTQPNTYTGGTHVQAGLLDLSSSAVVIPGPLSIGDALTPSATGATVRLTLPLENDQIADTAAVTVRSRGFLHLPGTVLNANETIGSLLLQGGRVDTGAGTLTLTADSSATSAADAEQTPVVHTTPLLQGTIRLATDLTFTVTDGPMPIDLSVEAAITGPGALTKAGDGTMELTTRAADDSSATNTYAGGTIVTGGTLLLSRGIDANPVPGDLTIEGGTVRLTIQDQIANDAHVSIGPGGLLDLADLTETIASLEMTGGTVRAPATEAFLELSGPITASPAGAETPLIEGRLLMSGPLEIAVNDGPSEIDLSIPADIGGTHGLTKSGAGRLVLSGSNNYSGTTLIGGVLRLGSAESLGAGGTSVSDGATLEILGDMSLVLPALSLSGSGAAGLGALHVAGDVTLGTIGGVTLASQSTVHVEQDGLLVFTIAGLLGPGGLLKTGEGRLVLPLPGSYAGSTTVAGGFLRIANGSALGDGPVTVASGAALELDGNMLQDSPAVTISGSGPDGGGALVNRFGNNNLWFVPLTLASDSVLFVAEATKLTIRSSITGAGGLIKAGAGELELGFTTGPTPNTYAGTTRVLEGELLLNKRSDLNAAVPGRLEIEAGGFAKVLFREQIADTATVVLGAGGFFSLTELANAPNPPNAVETICRLVDQGGSLLGGDRLVQTGDCPAGTDVPAPAGVLLVLALAFVAARSRRRS